MRRQDRKKLEALARKMKGLTPGRTSEQRALQYDATLKTKPDLDPAREAEFREMKRRPF